MHTTISEYISSKGITFRQNGKEFVTHCIFNDCDKDSTGNEAHLYISAENGLFHCKKCDAKGNIVTIAKHFGDDLSKLDVEGYEPPKKIARSKKPVDSQKFSEELILICHKALPDNIRQYLNGRGISDKMIEERKLGYGNFYWSNWITIPIRDESGLPLFFKLRRDPTDEKWPKYIVYPRKMEAMLYGMDNLNPWEELTVCEGEFDQMILSDHGIPAVTSTAWAGTFKQEWLDKFESLRRINIIFDNDPPGITWATHLQEKIHARYPEKEVIIVHIPEWKGKDVTEYAMAWWIIEDLWLGYSEKAEGIDFSRFAPMNASDIARVLSLSIEHDDITKTIVFLGMLSAFTNDSQFNILLNAPSSSGKSYIPLEVSKLFPEESVSKLQYVSQNAFFHEEGKYDKEENCRHIYLDRKILIFIDQPRLDLLARLRPMLSHDERVLVNKITDKNGQWGNMTKTAKIHWFPVAIFCTATSVLDEQEATRFLLLSPEISQKKLASSIKAKISKDSDKKRVDWVIEANTERMLLKDRIEIIRNAHISDICIENTKEIERMFLEWKPHLQPRHQRDIGRFIGLIKAFALLNMPFRKRKGDVIYADESDITEAYTIWKQVDAVQERNISPYLLDLYRWVVLSAYVESNQRRGKKKPSEFLGISRKEVYSMYYRIHGKTISDAKWRQDLESALIESGLISTERDGKTIIISPMNHEDVEIFLQKWEISV